MALTVTQPFAGHAVGEVITDPTQIKAIVGTEAERFVVRTADQATPPASTKED